MNKQKKKDLTTPPPADKKGLNFNAENLRKVPIWGAIASALEARLQDKDFDLGNTYNRLASQLNPIAAPHIGGYLKYNPKDENLQDAENRAMLAAAMRANRGLNRGTQSALNADLISRYFPAFAKAKAEFRQSEEARKNDIAKFNLGINQFNAQQDAAYDKLNTEILAQRLGYNAAGAKAIDDSKTAWANNVNTTWTNALNQIGNLGQDYWNKNQRDVWLNALGAEGIKELLKSNEGMGLLAWLGYNPSKS